MKLAAKFARQESEEARLARVARRRVPADRVSAILRALDMPDTAPAGPPLRTKPGHALACPACDRVFALPMHLGRHRKAKHGGSDAAW